MSLPTSASIELLLPLDIIVSLPAPPFTDELLLPVIVILSLSFPPVIVPLLSELFM